METVLNGPLELALRLLIVVDQQPHRSWTVDDLLALDHMAVHSGDFDGPPSLHPPFPLRSADIGARRAAIRHAVELLLHRRLFSIDLSESGVEFRPSEEVHSIAGLLEAPYAQELRSRGHWISENRSGSPEVPIANLIHQIVESWSEDSGAE